MVLLFQCKYRCVKLNMLKLAPKTEQDSNGTFHQGAFLLPRWPPDHLKAHICFDRCGFFCSLYSSAYAGFLCVGFEIHLDAHTQ